MFAGSRLLLPVHINFITDVYLWRFKLELLVKQSSLVDSIIELYVKWSRGPGSLVAVLSPNKKFLSSVFIYGKPVRNNAEILFLSGSGEQGSVIVSLKHVAL